MAFDGLAVEGQIEDLNGAPESGALIYFYLKGTTTLQAAYTDPELTTPAANPLVADSAGYWVAYLNPALEYDIVRKSSDEATTYPTISKSVGGSVQPLDSTLTALAGLSTADNQLIKATGSDMFEVVDPEVITGFVDVADAGIDNTGVTNNTAELATLLSNNTHLFFRNGTYLITPGLLSISSFKHLRGESEAGVILKMASPTASVSSQLIAVTGGAPIIENMTLDGDKATHISTYDFSDTQFLGWRGIVSSGAGTRVEHVSFQNFINSPCWMYGDDIIARHLTATACASGIYFGEITGAGPNSYSNAVIEHIHNFDMNTVLTGQAGSGRVLPHAIDVFNYDNSIVHDLQVYRQDGTASDMSSPQTSGISIIGCRKTICTALTVEDCLFNEGLHAVVTIPYNIDCNFSDIITRNHCGVGIECSGGENCVVSNFDVDGDYSAAGSNQISQSYGVASEQRSSVWNTILREHWDGGRNHRFVDGRIRGCGDGVRIFGGNCDLVNVEIYNNYRYGVYAFKPSAGQALGNYSGDGLYIDARIHGCDIHDNGAAGVYWTKGDVDIGAGTRLRNNNVRNVSNAQGIESTTDMEAFDTLKIGEVNFSMTAHEDDWAATAEVITGAVSYEPQTTTSVTDKYKDASSGTFYLADITLLISHENQSRIEEGANVIIKGALTSDADTATGRIISITEGVATVLFSSSQTLLGNSALLASADTISAQSDADAFGRATLTGSGTTWEDQFVGSDWVTDGSEWRQVVDVTSDTSLIINTPFTSTPSTLRALYADIELVPVANSTAMVFATDGRIHTTNAMTFEGYIPYQKMSMTSINIFEPGSIVYIDNTVTPDGTSTQLMGLTGLPEHTLLEHRATIVTAFTGGSGNCVFIKNEVGGGSGTATLQTLTATKNQKFSSVLIVPSSGSLFEHGSGGSVRYSIQHGSASTGSVRWERKIQLRELEDFPDVP